MDYNEGFDRYLRNESELAKRTIKNYINAIQTIKRVCNIDIYRISDVSEFEKTKVNIVNDKKFIEINKGSHDTEKSALLQYEKFFKEEINIPQNFEGKIRHFKEIAKIGYKKRIEEYEEIQKEMEEFKRKYNRDKIMQMGLSEYVSGTGEKDTFCNEIENGKVSRLGSLNGGRASGGAGKFGIWWYNKRTYAIIGKNMRRKEITLEEANVAFERVREVLLLIIDDKLDGEEKKIEESRVANGVINFLLSIYHPTKYMALTKQNTMDEVIKEFNGEAIDVSPDKKRKIILEQKEKNEETRGWSNYVFSQFLLRYYYSGREEDTKAKKGESESLKTNAGEEMKKDMNEIKKDNLNVILYGPPGTGKTYNTIKHAVSIIDGEEGIEEKSYEQILDRYNELKEKKQIEFTTFHQSYGYEEFIEGIGPVLKDEETQGTSDIKYKIKSGVFKEFCEQEIIEIRENPNIWKVSLAKTGPNAIREDCMNNNYIRVGWDEYGENIPEDKMVGQVMPAFHKKMKKGDIVVSCFTAERTDAIGVVTAEEPRWNDEFDTYKRIRDVKWIVKEIDENIVGLNNGNRMSNQTIHQLPSSMLQGIMDIIAKHQGKNKNTNNSDKKRVFIIDEINRGNISKIFGEIITLLEEDKRIGNPHAMEVTLPYSKKEFGIPNNVYVLGTMNTADRSLVRLDIALRRRFKFKEMMPDYAALRKILDDKNVNISGVANEEIVKILEEMNKRIECLLDREHVIGHSYFMRLDKNSEISDFGNIFKLDIIPLLQEYFYEDYEKIKKVLGNNKFIEEDEKLKETARNLKLGTDEEDEDRLYYKIADESEENKKEIWENPEEYKKIYS